MAYLEIRNLTKSYQGNLVLDHIDVELEQGMFLSLIGPSGCGKTTTLRLIAGFERQDEGTIMIGGKVMDKLPAYKRNIGMVFQSYALFPHMTVEQNVAYGLEQRNMTRADIRREVAKILEMVQLTGFERRKPKQLSGGQQQRVALARALVTKPSLLLLDESLSALDKNLRAAMQVELRWIQKEVGITTVFVTHDQEEAMTLSDRISVMRNGKIIQTGTPRHVYEHPVDTFVAGFLGHSNFLRGRVLDAAGGRAVFQLDNGGKLTIPHDPSAALRAGESVTLLIRPERIRLAKEEPQDAASVKGKIKFLTYSGSISMYLIDVLGHDIRVQRQNDDPNAAFKPGDDVYLSWDAANQKPLTE
jgi:spermidine/putrescine ABC transporter ATP-binding subunit